MERHAMPAKNKKRPPARLELIRNTLTRIIDGANAAHGATGSLDARKNPYAGVESNSSRQLISVEFYVAIEDTKGTGSKGRIGGPAGIAGGITESAFKRGRLGATSIKMTVSYEPWCTVNVVV